MINKKKLLGLIPARGGSKGVPGKNIKDLNGRPLIEYTIAAARESNYIDHLIVSTDIIEIRDLCKKVNTDVPFILSLIHI